MARHYESPRGPEEPQGKESKVPMSLSRWKRHELSGRIFFFVLSYAWGPCGLDAGDHVNGGFTRPSWEGLLSVLGFLLRNCFCRPSSFAGRVVLTSWGTQLYSETGFAVPTILQVQEVCASSRPLVRNLFCGPNNFAARGILCQF